MKLDYASLEQADMFLINKLIHGSPIYYFRALESLCTSSGWTLAEYWNTMLDKIDADCGFTTNNSNKLLN